MAGQAMVIHTTVRTTMEVTALDIGTAFRMDIIRDATIVYHITTTTTTTTAAKVLFLMDIAQLWLREADVQVQALREQ